MGYHGDTWEILSLSWNKDLVASLQHRPPNFRVIETIFWVLEFHFIKLNSYAAHFVSLTLQAISSFIFALFIDKAIVKNPKISALAMLTAFFFPATARMTYIIHTDNSRLASIFIWTSLIMFVHSNQSKEMKKIIIYFVLGSIFYLSSFFSYESFSFLLFLLPCILFSEKIEVKKSFPVKFIGTIITLFIFAVYIRQVILKGGAVGFKQNSAIFDTAIDLILLTTKNFYFGFLNSVDLNLSWVTALTLLLATVLITTLNRNLINYQKRHYVLIGISILSCILALLAYGLAGYKGDVTYLTGGRIYSSFAFGFSLILISFALILKNQLLRKIYFFILTFYILSSAVAHFKSQVYWQNAAVMQKNMYSSLLLECPDVLDSNSLLFVDTQNYFKERAVVFEGVSGSYTLPQIIYSKNAHGFLAYQSGYGSSFSEFSTEIWANRIKPRDRDYISKENIIILKFDGTKFTTVREVKLEDKFNFVWKDSQTKLVGSNCKSKLDKPGILFKKHYVDNLLDHVDAWKEKL